MNGILETAEIHGSIKGLMPIIDPRVSTDAKSVLVALICCLLTK